MTLPYPTRRVTDPAAARALRQDHAFLSRFLQPHSPSDVAAQLGMAANLAHHHARRLTELGLLFEERREGGKVYYQLTARDFAVPSDLLPPGEEGGNGTELLREFGPAYERAYLRSWATMRAGDEGHCIFGDEAQPAALDLQPAQDVSDEPYPTHSDTLTLRLTSERYRQLARDLSRLLTEAAQEGAERLKTGEEGEPCTFVLFALQGTLGDGGDFRGVARATDSFLGAE